MGIKIKTNNNEVLKNRLSMKQFGLVEKKNPPTLYELADFSVKWEQ